VIVPGKEKDRVMEICEKHGIKSWVIGKAIPEEKVFVKGIPL
ncbi:MAG: hypothetical protein JSV39_00460, partial [Candidatus Aenigmatarchaeota archaeon]